jgi:hypothetical protein
MSLSIDRRRLSIYKLLLLAQILTYDAVFHNNYFQLSNQCGKRNQRINDIIPCDKCCTQQKTKWKVDRQIIVRVLILIITQLNFLWNLRSMQFVMLRNTLVIQLNL